MISPRNNNNDDANNNNNSNSNDDEDGASSIATAMITSPNDAIILQHLSKNYDASSATLEKVAKKWEEDMRIRRGKLRRGWKRTFDEIREGSINVDTIGGAGYCSAGDATGTSASADGSTNGSRTNSRSANSKSSSDSNSHDNSNINNKATKARSAKESSSRILDKWKEFLESSSSSSHHYKKSTYLRYNGGIPSWEKQLQQWSQDVAAYVTKENEINVTTTWTEYLLKGKEETGYDLGRFGVVGSRRLKQLSGVTDNDDCKVEMNNEQVTTDSKQENNVDERSKSTKQSFRIGSTTTTISKATPANAAGAPLVSLTALEPNLPSLPKPHPVTPGQDIVPHTDISDLSKNIWIVTTASLPWMTGTAVNPLLRAAYLSSGRREKGGSVTLLLPWVERPADQERIYGKAGRFDTPESQSEYIRHWLCDAAKMKEASVELNIQWYTAWQEVAENSLYSMGGLIERIPSGRCDICVLEEPEHLNWYRAPGENWTSKFKHVVGIVHTNYFVYAQEQPAAFIRAPGMQLLCSWMCRAHCHRLIKLSGTLGNFAPEKELVENVHGVRRTYIDIGEELKRRLLNADKAAGLSDPVFSADATPKVYFIGKMLWSKGLGSLMELMKYAEESAGLKVTIDMYGGGPNKEEASGKASSMGLDMPFHGPIDHSELGFTHKIFVNPSLSEVLCTTVAEALAMGKFVVLPNHPSNDFFAQFPNCLPYSNKEEFVGNLYYALTHAPEPLTEEYSHALSWEAATERFAAAGSISVAEAEAMDNALKSTEAGIDISLPPLTTSEKQRKRLSRTFKKTRERYRSFRKRLSQDISKSNVLPKELQQRLITELDKRLDVDFDELMSSPKLRVKLSPAKLDKLLLELYDSVTYGPSGDVFRVIGGGANVGKQNLYMKQQQSKLTMTQYHVDLEDLEDSTPVSLVKKALRRNLLTKHQIDFEDDTLISSTKTSIDMRNNEQTPKMSLMPSTPITSASIRQLHRGSFVSYRPSFAPYRPSMPRYSPLI